MDGPWVMSTSTLLGTKRQTLRWMFSLYWNAELDDFLPWRRLEKGDPHKWRPQR